MEASVGGQRRLSKSSRHRIVAGVLGGIAEYLGVDPNIIRLIFIVVLFLNFYAALALYVAAAILLPSDDEKGVSRMPVEKAVLAVAALIMVFAGLSFVTSLAEVQRLIALLGTFTPIVGLVLLIAGVALLFMVLREQGRPQPSSS
ncbi:MAG: PspC domain-containing protein [Nitrososphaerota archaeon]|nr:PspC domain-containing protein [Candidatus Calditenuaceae archaeon]MDW8073682.1 PspC domain-containing protein [Nitrososphaerota archaeon]